ncbi:MAG: V-type ATPase subunit [Patescibacteria group bacterium]|nr:V-type ATPase subunit [Patescibacteria group bacterium]
MSLLFAVGNIRVKETQLINQNIIDRMIGADSIDTAYKILAEMDYSHHMNDVENASDFQQVLDATMKDLKDELQSILTEQEYSVLLWKKYDYHNLKLALKTQLCGAENSESFYSNLGIWTSDEVARIATDPAGQSASLSDAVLKAKELYTQTSNPIFIDVLLDVGYLKELQLIASQSNNEFVSAIIRIVTDQYNILSFLRLRELGKTESSLVRQVFVNGGSADASAFVSSLHKSFDHFVRTCISGSYSSKIKDVLAEYTKESNLFAVELGLQELLVSHINSSKTIALGIEPVLAFWIGKENNIKILRFILTAKQAGISKETIRERLPLHY